jgi:hypothetical protein
VPRVLSNVDDGDKASGYCLGIITDNRQGRGCLLATMVHGRLPSGDDVIRVRHMTVSVELQTFNPCSQSNEKAGKQSPGKSTDNLQLAYRNAL